MQLYVYISWMVYIVLDINGSQHNELFVATR